MSRSLHKLSARRVETVSTPGWHSDGGGLYLRLGKDGSKRWTFAWERDKRRREMGLGAFANVSLAMARERAAVARAQLADGLDPIEERRAAEEAERASRSADTPTGGGESKQAGEQASPHFGVFADKYIDTHADGWKSSKHHKQWRATLWTHAAALLEMPVDTITAEDVASVLRPIWRKIPETAGRVRGRIEIILDAAKASKHIASPWENPARWKGNLVHMLPRQRRKAQVKHHAAIPYEQMPDFFASLRRRGAPAGRALALTILCATRTNETLRMTWSEVDFDAGVWTIPGVRMKMGIEHRVPLSPLALQILQEQARTSNRRPDGYVFAGQKPGTPLSGMAMLMVLRRMNMGQYTVHGMRSSFRDYMGDMTGHPETIVEQALAHQVGDETVRAYRRGDAFLKRRVLMRDWECYLLGHDSQMLAKAVEDAQPLMEAAS